MASCVGKKAYPDEHSAVLALKRQADSAARLKAKRKGWRPNVACYPCRWCGAWHTTSHPRGTPEERTA